MMQTILKFAIRPLICASLLCAVGCIHRHPKPIAPDAMPATPATAPVMPATMPAPVAPPVGPTTTPVATEDLGKVSPLPGLAKPPKPFIAFPKMTQAAYPGAQPSTLLMEHASPDSPIPLSDYARQPIFTPEDFHIRSTLTAADVEQRLGLPAQEAVNDDPWLVYRLTGNREMWLHFGGPKNDRLLAADVIRGAEDGYVRERIFHAP